MWDFLGVPLFLLYFSLVPCPVSLVPSPCLSRVLCGVPPYLSSLALFLPPPCKGRGHRISLARACVSPSARIPRATLSLIPCPLSLVPCPLSSRLAAPSLTPYPISHVPAAVSSFHLVATSSALRVLWTPRYTYSLVCHLPLCSTRPLLTFNSSPRIPYPLSRFPFSVGHHSIFALAPHRLMS